MPVASMLLDAALNDRDAAHRMINAWSFAKPADGSPLNPELLSRNERLLQSQAAGVLHRDLNACNDYDAGLAAAARVFCPTLLLGAALDRMASPKAGAALVAAFGERAHTVILPDAGHAMMSEAPEAVCAALWSFVTGPPD
jgi:pimeloyl-ACP methyl ester carboxylesterase